MTVERFSDAPNLSDARAKVLQSIEGDFSSLILDRCRLDQPLRRSVSRSAAQK